MRLRIFWAVVVIALALVSPSLTHAQSPIVVSSQSVDIRFPDEMQFRINVSSKDPIRLLRLTVWQDGVALGSRHIPRFTPAPTVSVTFNWKFQGLGDGGYLPPGTQGEYTWRIEDSAGNTYDTPRQRYSVTDPTQTWKVLSNDYLRISWYSGDDAFGQAVWERALNAREFLSQELGIEDVDPLEVFIYGDTQAFFESLPPFSAEWTGGRMFPEYGVVMINFPPQNLEWGLRAVSHELSHAILHAKIQGTIGALSVPHWLDEGLAVYNETNDHAPDEQFEQGFQNAVRRNTLIPLRSMQLRFPDDSEQALLAYGQSYSVVKFMIEEYGEEKFAALLDLYGAGTSPDEGLIQIYNLNHDELENEWRRKIGAPLRQVFSSQLPTLPARPTYELSSLAGTTTPQPSPTIEPTRVSVAEPPPTIAPSPEQSPAVPGNELCGGGLALGGLVTFSLLKRSRRSRRASF